MASVQGTAVRGQATETMEVTLDEAAVLQLIRRTPYGVVVTKMRAGTIIGMERNETFVPPSLSKQPKLLNDKEP